MNEHGKTLLIIGGVILTAVIVFVTTLFATGRMCFEKENGRYYLVVNMDPDSEDSYDQNIRESKEKYPTEIFVYGDDCHFREEVEWTKITKLSPEQVASDKEFRVIVINDLNGKLNLTNKDMEFIENFVCDEKHLVMYFGDSKFDKFIEAGIISDSTLLSSGDMSVVYKYHDLPSMRVSCIWHEEDNEIYLKDNEEVLGTVIFNYLGSYYRDYDANGSK